MRSHEVTLRPYESSPADASGRQVLVGAGGPVAGARPQGSGGPVVLLAPAPYQEGAGDACRDHGRAGAHREQGEGGRFAGRGQVLQRGARSMVVATGATCRIGPTDLTEPSALSSTCLLLGCRKSNMPFSEPARASKEASPIRPVCQLFSMNLMIEVCSVRVWSIC